MEYFWKDIDNERWRQRQFKLKKNSYLAQQTSLKPKRFDNFVEHIHIDMC